MGKKLTIVITGATAGIGRHTALHLVRAGHHVIATGRRKAALEELSREGAAGPGTLEALELDVTDAASIASAVSAVERLTGGRGPDALINNAGYGQSGALEEIGDEVLRAQFETNVFGLMAVTRAFLPSMRARGSGRILNVSSVGGRVTFPMFGAYNATKYAVESLSDALRVEVASAGIQVVLIEPGPIRSEFGDRALASIEPYRQRTDSPYAPVYARAETIKRLTEGQAVGPERVARVMERALTARRPHARYVVPFSSRLVLWAMTLLPTGLMDALLRWSIGLRRPALPPPRASLTDGGQPA